MLDLEIRSETESDYTSIHNLVQMAFATMPYRTGIEQDLVLDLRKGTAYIKDLAIVAINKNKLLGYILFTKALIGNYTALSLAILAVLPEYQKQGIGRQLITAGHNIAQQLGFAYVFVVGHADYYPKFGYVPAKNLHFYPEFNVPSKNFMVAKLLDQPDNITGIVHYAQEFGVI